MKNKIYTLTGLVCIAVIAIFSSVIYNSHINEKKGCNEAKIPL